MRTKMPTLWGALTISLLSGCAGRKDVAIRLVEPSGLTASATLDEHLAKGRALLGGGQFGLAIAQFRAALQADDKSAAAQNGLAIAYAKLGRDDLARRYFVLAMVNAPGDEAYKRNYQRLADSSKSQADGNAQVVDVSGNASDEASTAALTATPKVLPVPDQFQDQHIASGKPSPDRIVAVTPGMSLLVTRLPIQREAPKQEAEASKVAASDQSSGAAMAMARRAVDGLVSLVRPALDRVGLDRVRLSTKVTYRGASAPIPAPAESVQPRVSPDAKKVDEAAGKVALFSAVERARERRIGYRTSAISFFQPCRQLTSVRSVAYFPSAFPSVSRCST